MYVFKWITLPLIVVLSSLILSCSTPYFGYTKGEWNKLSNLEQDRVTESYSKIIASQQTIKQQDRNDDIEQSVSQHGQGNHVEWQNEY